MAMLRFSFAGESIQSSPLVSKVRRFELEFEPSAQAALQGRTAFTVEYFFSIDAYAENLNAAFHMAAAEAGIQVDKLEIHIEGNLRSGTKGMPGEHAFNKVDVSLVIVSDATDAILEAVLRLAKELSPADRSLDDDVQFRFFLNTVIHLN